MELSTQTPAIIWTLKRKPITKKSIFVHIIFWRYWKSCARLKIKSGYRRDPKIILGNIWIISSSPFLMKDNNSPFFRIKIIASLLSAISCVVTFFCILYNILEVFASVCKVFLIYQKTNHKEFAEAVNLTKTNRLSQCFWSRYLMELKTKLERIALKNTSKS